MFSTGEEGNSSCTGIHGTVVVQQCCVSALVHGYKGTDVIQGYMCTSVAQGYWGRLIVP
jgi:hypothetical protein